MFAKQVLAFIIIRFFKWFLIDTTSSLRDHRFFESTLNLMGFTGDFWCEIYQKPLLA